MNKKTDSAFLPSIVYHIAKGRIVQGGFVQSRVVQGRVDKDGIIFDDQISILRSTIFDLHLSVSNGTVRLKSTHGMILVSTL